MQAGRRKIPQFKDKPLLPEVATSERDREVLSFLSQLPSMGRPFFMPPNTPPERVAAVRRAFELTMADKHSWPTRRGSSSTSNR